MNCEALDTLYVRANGEIPCGDDAGERIALAHCGREEGWSLRAALDSDSYCSIRRAFAAGREPWGGACRECALLRRAEAPIDHLKRGRIVRLQIEPSLECGLRCPDCSQARQLAEREGPAHLPVADFERLLATIRREGFAVEEIEYCGQGEPLSHPDFARLVAGARASLPKARQRLVTNGNYAFTDALRGERLDEIIVSCDGLFQTSYARYRVGGSVEKALAFFLDAARCGPVRPYLVWKYILLEFNDSDEEILAAQAEAERLGVDEFLLVLTHSAHRSRRFALESAARIPLASPIARLRCTPALERNRAGRGLLPGWAGRTLRIARSRLRLALVRRPTLRRWFRRRQLLTRLAEAARRIA